MASGAQFSRSGLDTLRVVDLRELLRSLGLPVSGVKRELIDRIIEHQLRMQTKSLLLDLEISKLELSSKEMEISLFRSANINLASSRLNLTANPAGAVSRIPDQISQVHPNMIYAQNSPAAHVNAIQNSPGINIGENGEKGQHQIGQVTGSGQNSFTHVSNDMQRTLPNVSNHIHVFGQANEPRADIQAGQISTQNSIVQSQAMSNDSEWLISQPTTPQPVTQLDAPQPKPKPSLYCHTTLMTELPHLCQMITILGCLNLGTGPLSIHSRSVGGTSLHYHLNLIQYYQNTHPNPMISGFQINPVLQLLHPAWSCLLRVKSVPILKLWFHPIQIQCQMITPIHTCPVATAMRVLMTVSFEHSSIGN